MYLNTLFDGVQLLNYREWIIQVLSHTHTLELSGEFWGKNIDCLGQTWGPANQNLRVVPHHHFIFKVPLSKCAGRLEPWICEDRPLIYIWVSGIYWTPVRMNDFPTINHQAEGSFRPPNTVGTVPCRSNALSLCDFREEKERGAPHLRQSCFNIFASEVSLVNQN